MRVFAFGLFGDFDKLCQVGTNIGLALCKFAHNLLLLLGVRGKESHREGFALEEIGHQDEGIERGCKTVSALKGLRDEAKDVVDGNESFLGGSGTGLIWVRRAASALWLSNLLKRAKSQYSQTLSPAMSM